jgi:hypothetical protein
MRYLSLTLRGSGRTESPTAIDIPLEQRAHFEFSPPPNQSSPVNRYTSIFKTKSTVDDQERPRTDKFRNAPLEAVVLTPDGSMPSCVHIRSGALWALSPDRSVPRPAKNGAPRPTWRNRRRARRRQSVNARSGRPEFCNRTPSARSKQNWRLRPSIKRHFPSFSTSFSTVFSVFFQLCTRGGHWADGKGTQNGPFRSQALCPPEPTHRVRPDLAGRRSKVVTRRQAVHTMSSSTCGHSFTPWARRASRPQWFDRPARLHPPLETRHHAAI